MNSDEARAGRVLRDSADTLSVALVHLARAAKELEEVAERLLVEARRPSPTPWMNVEETADYMRVSASTVNHLVASEQLASALVTADPKGQRGRRVVHRDDADAYLKDRRHGTNVRGRRR